MTEEQRRIGEMIIGNIDDRGRLSESVEALSFSSGESGTKIAAVLKIIQTFDPPGVAARDLRECLMLQMERAGKGKIGGIPHRARFHGRPRPSASCRRSPGERV
jgi:DNA-directed RNA polymerase specialized sigma54-like protein